MANDSILELAPEARDTIGYMKLVSVFTYLQVSRNVNSVELYEAFTPFLDSFSVNIRNIGLIFFAFEQARERYSHLFGISKEGKPVFYVNLSK